MQTDVQQTPGFLHKKAGGLFSARDEQPGSDHADEGQVPVHFVQIQPIAKNESIRNPKTNIVQCHIHLAPLGLVHSVQMRKEAGLRAPNTRVI